MTSKLFGLITALALAGCASPFQVRRVTDTSTAGKDSIIYALPRSTIVVELPFTREVRGGATCTAALADPKNARERETFNEALTRHGLDNLADLIDQLGVKGRRVTIALATDPGPALTNRAEPDPEAIFAVDLSSERARKKSLQLTLGELGVFEAGNTASEETASEIVVEVVTTVIAIAATVAAALDESANLEPCRQDLKALDALEERRKKLVHGLESGNRGNLSHELVKLLLDDIRAEKDELLDKYRGVVVAKETAKIRCEVTPAAGKSPWNLLTLAGEDLTAGTNGGCRVPEKWKPTGAASKVTHSFDLSLTPYADDPVLKAAKQSGALYDANKNQPSGMVYRVPARTRIQLSRTTVKDAETSTTTLATTETQIPQLGVLLALPDASAIKNTKATLGLSLHPATGAPKEVKIEYGTAAVPDASGVAEKAAPLIERAGTKQRLERQKDELELEAKIFELQCAKAKREGVSRAECEAK